MLIEPMPRAPQLNRRGLFLVVMGALSVVIAGMAAAQKAKKPLTLTDMAKEFLTAYVKKDYKTASKRFDATMKKAFPPAKMKSIWDGLEAKVGKFKKQGGVRTGKIEQYDIVYITCAFEKAELDCKVVFNSKKQIAGLFFMPKGSK